MGINLTIFCSAFLVKGAKGMGDRKQNWFYNFLVFFYNFLPKENEFPNHNISVPSIWLAKFSIEILSPLQKGRKNNVQDTRETQNFKQFFLLS